MQLGKVPPLLARYHYLLELDALVLSSVSVYALSMEDKRELSFQSHLCPSIARVVSRGFSHSLLPLTQENATLGNAEVLGFDHSIQQPL